jgi:YggT family protein
MLVIQGVIRDVIAFFVLILIIAIFARVLLSWFPTANRYNPIIALIYQLTEPILGPLKKIIPRVGVFDFTPTIALFILFLIFSSLGGL